MCYLTHFFGETFTDCFRKQAPLACVIRMDYKLINKKSYEMAMTLSKQTAHKPISSQPTLIDNVCTSKFQV